MILCAGKGVDGVEVNPLKSVYVVSNPSPQLFVVPCFNYFPSQHFANVDLALQKRKLPQSGSADTLWESVHNVPNSFCAFSLLLLSFDSLYSSSRQSSLVKMLFSLQIDLSVKSYFNWSFADFKGIAIRHPKSGEYRCGAVTFNSTCPVPKWSLYSFFIVHGIQSELNGLF